MTYNTSALDLKQEHISQLPPAPKTERELWAYLRKKGFDQLRDKEMTRLRDIEAFKLVPIAKAKSLLLLVKQVNGYKIDLDGYLESFKSRLVTRGDL